MANQRKFRHLLIAGALLVVLVASASGTALANDPDTQFYVAKPNQGAREQIADVISSGNKADADLIREMIDTPQAVWFEGDSPHRVQQDVKNTVKRAAGKKTVPCDTAKCKRCGVC